MACRSDRQESGAGRPLIHKAGRPTESPILQPYLGQPQIKFGELLDRRRSKTRHYLGGLPERVMALSTGDLLRDLEAAGRIQSADHLLNMAAENERNITAQCEPQRDADARDVLRQQLIRNGLPGLGS